MRAILLTLGIASCLVGCTGPVATDTGAETTGSRTTETPRENMATTENTATTTSTSATGPAPIDLESVAIEVDEPNSTDPVAFAAALDRAEIHPGESVLLVIRAKIAEPWHIYSVDGPTGVGRPTKFTLTLPSGVQASTEWILPEAKVDETELGPVSAYHGDVRFAVPLTVDTSVANGLAEVQCNVQFQACTDQQCLPPASKDLSLPLVVSTDGT